MLATKWDDEDFRSYRDAFPESATLSPEAFEAHVNDLTERDVKVAYLKDLQGVNPSPRSDNVNVRDRGFPTFSAMLKQIRVPLGRRLQVTYLFDTTIP